MSKPEPSIRPAISARRRTVVLVGMMCGASLAAIDQMVVATAVGTIAGELGEMRQAPWLFTANLLASASSMPIWGKLGDLFGRKRVFQSAIILFTVASLLASQSQSMGWLLVCRALQGLGGGALITMPYAILADVIAPSERPKYVALVTVVWTVAALLGPPLGGYMADGPGWRWMFALNVPGALVAFALLQWAYRVPPVRTEHEVDYGGAVLLFTSVGSLVLYSSWAGAAFGWLDPRALAFLVASAVLGGGFFSWEGRAAEPILELSVFRARAVWAPLATTFLYGLGNFAITFLVPLTSLVVYGTSKQTAGLGLMPLTLALFFSGLIAGRLAAASRRYRRYASIGLVLYGAGIALLSTLDADTPRAVFWSYSFLLGVGSGPLNPVLIASLQNALDARHLGVASSLSGFGRAVAQTIGSSALGTLLAIRFAAHLEREVRPTLAPGTALESLTGSPEAIRALAEPLRSAVVDAYCGALHDTYLAMLALVVCSFTAARFLLDPASSATGGSASPSETTPSARVAGSRPTAA